MKYNKFIMLLLAVLIILVGCNKKEVSEPVDEVIDEDLYIDMETDYTGDNSVVMTKEQLQKEYGKENYDYKNFMEDEDKIEFYKKHEIYYGEEKNQKEDKYLIYAFSPTCIYCQDFFDTLKTYTEKENSLPLYAVNLTVYDNEEFLYDYEIEGTPTLLLYNKLTDEIEHTYVGVQKLEELPYK